MYRCFKRLAKANVFQLGKQKDCIMKVLNLLPYLITVFLQSYITLALKYVYNFIEVVLKQEKSKFNLITVVNIYLVYEINLWPFKQSTDFTLRNSFFEAFKLNKNTDFNKYKYSAYGIGFDAHGSLLLSDGNGFDAHGSLLLSDGNGFDAHGSLLLSDGNGFDAHGSLLLSDGNGFGKNLIYLVLI